MVSLTIPAKHHILATATNLQLRGGRDCGIANEEKQARLQVIPLVWDAVALGRKETPQALSVEPSLDLA